MLNSKKLFKKDNFDYNELRRYVKYAVGSYQGKYSNIKLPYGFESIVLDNVMYFRKAFKNEYVIVIKGSDDFKDWKNNFEFSKLYFRNGEVHKGFFKQAVKIFRSENFKNKDKKITIVGHSSGAAVAQALALLLESLNFKYLNIITLGSPRVFCLKLVRYFNKNIKHYRIVNGIDIVTFLPPIIFNYFHTGLKIQIGKAKWYKNLLYLFFKSLKDHKPDLYYYNFNLNKRLPYEK